MKHRPMAMHWAKEDQHNGTDTVQVRRPRAFHHCICRSTPAGYNPQGDRRGRRDPVLGMNTCRWGCHIQGLNTCKSPPALRGYS